jgi:hypothetical protein
MPTGAVCRCIVEEQPGQVAELRMSGADGKVAKDIQPCSLESIEQDPCHADRF